MIGLQYDRLSLQPHIHILSGDRFQIVRQIELDAYPLQTVSEDLADRIEIAGKLVHISSRAMPLWHNKDKSENP